MAFDPLTAALDIGSKVIDRLWPNKADADTAKLKLLEMQQTGELAQLASETSLAQGQIEINKEEAISSSLWVAGARPFILWVCGVSFAYHFVIEPLMAFTLSAFGHPVSLPEFDMETLTTVLLGMLGFGGLRTYERVKGVIPPGK